MRRRRVKWLPSRQCFLHDAEHEPHEWQSNGVAHVCPGISPTKERPMTDQPADSRILDRVTMDCTVTAVEGVYAFPGDHHEMWQAVTVRPNSPDEADPFAVPVRLARFHVGDTVTVTVERHQVR